jgi:transposase
MRLRNNEWRKIHEFLQGCPVVCVGSTRQCRRLVEAVLWVGRSGAQWRLLPREYGQWNSVYKRYAVV